MALQRARYFIINNNLNTPCKIFMLDGPTQSNASRRLLIEVPGGGVRHFDLSTLTEPKLESLHKVQAHALTSQGGASIDPTVLEFIPTSTKQARYHVTGTAAQPVITFMQLEDATW